MFFALNVSVDCRTNYHNNFSVHAGLRTYYPGVPDLIQVGEHQFAESRLVNMWISSMLLGWCVANSICDSLGLTREPIGSLLQTARSCTMSRSRTVQSWRLVAGNSGSSSRQTTYGTASSSNHY